MSKFRILIGFLISFVFIYLIIWKPQPGAVLHGELSFLEGFFGTTQINFSEVWIQIRKASPLWLLICLAITPLHVLVRSHRWILMIKSVGKIKLIDSFSLQMVGYMANAIFPMRFGEVLRGILLARKAKIQKSTGLATVLLERVLDLITLLIVFSVVLFIYSFPESFPGFLRKGAAILGVMTLVFLVIILYYSLAKNPFSGFTGSLLNLFPGPIKKRVIHTIQGFINGFSMLKTSRDYPLIAFESLLLWVLYTAQEFACIVAFNFHIDYPLIASAPLTAALVILVINAVALSIPSAPGGVGTFHGAAVLALSLFGIAEEPAAGFAVVLHALSFFFYIFVGGFFMGREGLKINELKTIGTEKGNEV